jgi:hypothetical protein
MSSTGPGGRGRGSVRRRYSQPAGRCAASQVRARTPYTIVGATFLESLAGLVDPSVVRRIIEIYVKLSQNTSRGGPPCMGIVVHAGLEVVRHYNDHQGLCALSRTADIRQIGGGAHPT